MSSHELFKPTARDRVIDTICSNLVWCGLLRRSEQARYMAHLYRLTDSELESTVIESRMQLDSYLSCACRN